MLPTPAIRTHHLTGLVRALDRWTLWAFNPPAGRR